MASTSTLLPSKDSSRRGRRSAELRERLFRAALDQFAKKGYLETTVEDITNAADVGKGTFFNYFPSKDHILLAFGELQLGKLQLAMDEARSTSMPLPEFLRSLGTRVHCSSFSSGLPFFDSSALGDDGSAEPCPGAAFADDSAGPGARRDPRRFAAHRNCAGIPANHFRHAAALVALWRWQPADAD